MTQCRPRNLLIQFSQDYPGIWGPTQELAKDKGRHPLPDWPSWCYLPMAGSYAAISNAVNMPRLGLAHVGDVSRHAALAAWRLGQGVYRFDPAVYEAVKETPVSGDIPHQVLYRLPEWCIYIETPGLDDALHGAFVHLEFDVNNARPELRLLLDADHGLIPMPLHLGAWSLAESIERMIAEAEIQRADAGLGRVDEGEKGIAQKISAPIMSMVLFICSQIEEIGADGHRPSHAKPKRTKRGDQFFAAEKPTTWDVGVRMGSALRRAYQAEQVGLAGQHAGPRPHIRRAHWHGFRSGPRVRPDGSEIVASERAFDLRWMPPIAVNVADIDTLPATIRTIKE